MAKFRRFHQVTIDEYIASQVALEGDLFPDASVAPAVVRSSGSFRVSTSPAAPVFPDAPIDGVGAAPAAPAPVRVVRAFSARKIR